MQPNRGDDADEGEPNSLAWVKRYSTLTGRVVSLTLEASTFPQERFLTDFAREMEEADSISIKVYSRRGLDVRVAILANEELGDDDLEESDDDAGY